MLAVGLESVSSLPDSPICPKASPGRSLCAAVLLSCSYESTYK